MDQDFFKNLKNTKKLATTMAVYSGASIFGPLVLFGGAGYFLDKYFQTKPLLIIVGVFLAFIISNILLYKKAMALTGYINSKYNQDKAKEDGEDDLKSEEKETK